VALPVPVSKQAMSTFWRRCALLPLFYTVQEFFAMT
jgi:hypothetical protein